MKLEIRNDERAKLIKNQFSNTSSEAEMYSYGNDCTVIYSYRDNTECISVRTPYPPKKEELEEIASILIKRNTDIKYNEPYMRNYDGTIAYITYIFAKEFNNKRVSKDIEFETFLNAIKSDIKSLFSKKKSS